MDLVATAVTGLYAGVFASAVAVILTGPPRYIAPAFVCGFAGRFARDAFMGLGMSQNWATVVAACVVVLVAVASIRRRVVSPVVLITGVLPIGAAVAVFQVIVGLMRVSSLDGEALAGASIALSASLGKAFTTSMGIALGLAAGMAVVRLSRRAGGWEEI